MCELLRKKAEAIAESYADIVALRIQAALSESEIDSTAMMEINDGIRMLSHLSTTLQKIEYLRRNNDTTMPGSC